jgi:DNA polymerase III delta subunit
MLDTLLAQKEKHLSVLGMIIRQYRLMLLAYEYQNEKMSQESIGDKLKLRGYPLQNILKLSKNYDEKSLMNGFKKCLDTDYKIKNGVFSGDELDLSLEILIAELCK